VTATGYIGGDPNKLDRTGYTKGDVVAADVTGALQAVPVGPDNDVLTADSVAAEGVDWQAGGGGGGSTPSNTVVTETSFGQASTAGIATTHSRGDHTHGTMAAPTPASIGAVPTTRTLTASTGLSGGGDLSADRSFAVLFGTAGGTAAEGNDTRITGAQQRSTLSAKGDLYVATASATTTREPVGADGTVLTADSAQTSGIKWATPSGGASVKITAGTPNTSGNVTPATGLPYTAIDSDISIAAVTNDYIGLMIECLLNDSGSTIIVDAASRVAAADVNYLSSGTNTPLFPGGRPGWYHTPIAANVFPGVAAEIRYRVQAGDLSGGTITLRPYATCEGTARAVFRNASFPLRVWLFNYGQG
jgi:hypothetical protein